MKAPKMTLKQANRPGTVGSALVIGDDREQGGRGLGARPLLLLGFLYIHSPNVSQ